MKRKVYRITVALVILLVMLALPLAAMAKNKEVGPPEEKSSVKLDFSETKLNRGQAKKALREQNNEKVAREELKEAIKEQVKLRLLDKKQTLKLSKAKKEQIKERKLEQRIFVRGVNPKFDIPPVIKDGRTLVPVRAITEGLGAELQWDQENRTVTIVRDDKTIVLTLDDVSITVNGEPYELELPAQLICNRTFVPIRFISEILGEKVEYDEDTGEIDIGLEDDEEIEEIDEEADDGAGDEKALE